MYRAISGVVALAACYTLAAVWLIGPDKFPPLPRPAMHRVELDGGTVQNFDASKGRLELFRDVLSAYKADASALAKSGKSTETHELAANLTSRSKELVDNLIGRNEKRKDAAYRALAIVILPPACLFALSAFVGGAATGKKSAYRLGGVLFWTAWIFLGGCLAIGWVGYRGADTTGIELAREHGQSDEQIFNQRNASEGKYGYREFDYEGALKAGYSRTEILDFIVWQSRSLNVPMLMLAAGAAAVLLSWIAGCALGRTASGQHKQSEREGQRTEERRRRQPEQEGEATHRRQAEQERKAEQDRQQKHDKAAQQGSETNEWWTVLEVSPRASKEEIVRSYRNKIRQYHRDRVSGLGPELIELAETRTKALNAAYSQAIKGCP